MFALRRNNPDPAGGSFIEVSLAVDSHAVGNTGGRIFADVDEHYPIGERAVRLDIVTLDELIAAAIRIKIFFVRRKGEPVCVRNIRDHPGYLTVPKRVDPVEIQLLSWIFFPEAQTAKAVSEVD